MWPHPGAAPIGAASELEAGTAPSKFDNKSQILFFKNGGAAKSCKILSNFLAAVKFKSCENLKKPQIFDILFIEDRKGNKNPTYFFRRNQT